MGWNDLTEPEYFISYSDSATKTELPCFISRKIKSYGIFNTSGKEGVIGYCSAYINFRRIVKSTTMDKRLCNFVYCFQLQKYAKKCH